MGHEGSVSLPKTARVSASGHSTWEQKGGVHSLGVLAGDP